MISRRVNDAEKGTLDMKKTFIGGRVLAVILTLAMLIACAGVVPPALTASAANASFDGFIYNGDFETGVASGWNLGKSATFVAGGHDGSAYALRFAGTAWANCNQSITVKANTNYRISGWVKRVAGTGAHHFYAQNTSGQNCERINGTQTWFSYSGDIWIQHVLDFNSGANTTLKFYISVEDPESVFLYDDVQIQEIGPDSGEGRISNGDFELGAAGGWMINGASTFYPGGRNGSDYSVRLLGDPGVALRQFVRVKGMTDYRLTVCAKRSRGSGRNQVSVRRGDTVIGFANGADGIIDETEREWFEHVYEFNSGPATQITVFLQMLDSGASFYYDDISLEEITGPDYSGVIKGDADLDGVLGENDAALLRRHLAGETALEGEAAYAADMDYDGGVTAEDLALLELALNPDNTAAIPLYPIRGETVARGSWQVEELFADDYEPGKSDSYSNIAARNDQYMRDAVVLRWMSSIPQRSYTVLLADNRELKNAKTYLAQETTLSIQNLLVDTDYYWAVEIAGVRSAVGTFHTAKTVRTLWIEGVSNTRDIGGWLTEDGQYRVKYDVAFRGAKFDVITDAGRAAVADLGLKTDVDLRTDGEGTAAPLGDLAEWYHVGPNGAAMYYTDSSSSISNLTGGHVRGTINAIRVYADSSKFPAYFHCSYGRDRTGTLAFLLLGMLGVSKLDIQRDYEMTFLSQFGGGGGSAAAALASLNKTIDWVTANYAVGGTLKESCEAYLRAAGLTAAEIEAVRANLLEPVGGGETLAGDIDGDGEVTVADALSALRAAVGLAQIGEEAFAAADVDADGAITVSDALRILRAAAGLAAGA